MGPEHEGPSMGHILSEVSKDVEVWPQLTSEQAHAIAEHLEVYLEIVDPSLVPVSVGLRRKEVPQLVSTRESEERYWESFDRVQNTKVDANVIHHAEHIAAALVISDLRTRLGLRSR